MHTFVHLTSLQRYSDAALLLQRVLIGAFLIWGVWDNIVSAERMDEFVAFLTKFGFPAPALMARVSVWAQFFVGVSFITGFATRWAGVLCAVNFIVALVMVDRFGGLRAAFPSMCLVLIGLYLATHGAGRFSVDSRLMAKAGAHA
jgi:putative oxidoreductase